MNDNNNLERKLAKIDLPPNLIEDTDQYEGKPFYSKYCVSYFPIGSYIL